jgi:phage terminase large subunit-like protein
MHYDSTRDDVHPDDPRSDGELLNPALKDEFAVRREARAILEAGADVEAQHEQRPVPPGGKVFKREWIQYWSVLPPNVSFYQSWDFTFGGSQRSWVVGQVWATDGEAHYLVDQTRSQTDYPGMKGMMRDLVGRYPQTSIVYSEGAALGKAINQELSYEFPQIEEVSVSGVGGKLVRARAVTGVFSDGRVFFPHPHQVEIGGRRRRSDWVDGLITRLLRFTGAASDISDEVDCISQYLGRQRQSGIEVLLGAKWD